MPGTQQPCPDDTLPVPLLPRDLLGSSSFSCRPGQLGLLSVWGRGTSPWPRLQEQRFWWIESGLRAAV